MLTMMSAPLLTLLNNQIAWLPHMDVADDLVSRNVSGLVALLDHDLQG